ncbi:phosphonate ABC transporter, permease protein PhnE [Sneathiella chungangensis]|uniref:Phosphonate ABC transporter, permease protein PhnE n=2 Tax=Sneathiella chungangensis TaxID=1418234 RepID=A0A845MIE6_9PROT|nr:phosphonate ABC transporter, permease protein PhnE [Sneathiella chungangensis]MZR23190.1 phosphonate ABC transporter, permease protein PhnE [Sneathiella chungangensis]
MTMPSTSHAKRNPFPVNWPSRIIWVALLAYLVYALSLIDISSERMIAGFGHGADMLGRMVPPDFSRWSLLLEGLLESLEIAILASAVGITLSLPIGFFAARNMMPPWVSWPARTLIAVCRSFHPVIVAIIFVKAVGFGALAGILALIVASVGFIAKLFAEAIEEISLKQVEAVRASGASFGNVIIFSVVPQVLSRFVGFSTYQVDSNLRNSTMVGIVGAGGIGGTLFSAFQRFDYDFVAAILISLIAVIMAGEYFSTWVKGVFK